MSEMSHQHSNGENAHHGGDGAIKISAHATMHCLSGCIIGEVAGLVIGVTIGLSTWPMIILATVLSYVSGITLGLLSVMRSQRIGVLQTLRIIWVGEVISIAIMEIAMNFVDYQMGGMGAKSIIHWTFWQGLMFAVPAGFLAGWPVNYWLIKRELKAGH